MTLYIHLNILRVIFLEGRDLVFPPPPGTSEDLHMSGKGYEMREQKIWALVTASLPLPRDIISDRSQACRCL
jgi:hypothetical protein